jgi:DNA-binding NtrC family response regulator
MCPSPDNIQDKRSGLIHIIVVDDEPTLRLGFNYTLASETTAVSTAENGRIAIDMLAKRHYDLMILDLRMPEMDGIDVLKAVRASGNPIPIILCSAGFTPKAALEAIRNGVVNFLFKPLRPVEIRDAVDALLTPEKEATENALKAVRSGHPEEAIRILNHCSETNPRGFAWLRILRDLRDTEPGADATLIDIIDASLPLLAMNAQASR